jgi:tryptophan 2,3-dioxygenase
MARPSHRINKAMDSKPKKETPEYGQSPLTYGDYLKVPELLSQQRCLTDPPSHDELQFIIIHQTYELWFKLMLFEVDSIIQSMGERNIRYATWLLHRVIAIAKLLYQQIHILETMTPLDFLDFRHKLNPASGFQSLQFRELEFVSNLKNPKILDHLKSDQESLGKLKKRLEQPTLWDAFLDLFKSQGFDVADSETIKREIARLHQEHHNHYDLFLLSEALIEYDEFFGLWRQHHVRMVERMIGNKMGTGGSEGVRYLTSTLDKKCFPDLWDARTYIEKSP